MITRGSCAAALLDRGVQVAGIADPGDADAGAQPRRLDPERHPQRKGALTPVVGERLDKSDLWNTIFGAKPSSRSACPCRRPSRARPSRRMARQRYRALPGSRRPRRKAREGRGRRRRHRPVRRRGSIETGSPSIVHSPSREITTGTTSWPAWPKARGDGLARTQRNFVLAGATADEYRDPHQGGGYSA